MEVLFLQDVANQAHAGQVKRVKDGYARNYLIPKGLAAMVTSEVLKRQQKVRVRGDERRARETQQMEELARIIDGAQIEVEARVTPNGRYYGAITAGRIADELGRKLDREFDRRIVEIMEPIREPGEYEVSLHLAGDITATIKIMAGVEE